MYTHSPYTIHLKMIRSQRAKWRFRENRSTVVWCLLFANENSVFSFSLELFRVNKTTNVYLLLWESLVIVVFATFSCTPSAMRVDNMYIITLLHVVIESVLTARLYIFVCIYIRLMMWKKINQKNITPNQRNGTRAHTHTNALCKYTKWVFEKKTTKIYSSQNLHDILQSTSSHYARLFFPLWL